MDVRTGVSYCMGVVREAGGDVYMRRPFWFVPVPLEDVELRLEVPHVPQLDAGVRGPGQHPGDIW